MTPHQAPSVPSGGRQATSREFFAVIFRRKWLILGLFLVTVATVLVIAVTTPVEYASSGRVLVKRGEQQSSLAPNRQVFNEWEEDLGSEIEVAKSYPVLQRTRQLLREESSKLGRTIAMEATSVDIEVMGKSNVLGIGYTSRDPEVAQTVCNALITAYVEFRQNKLALTKPGSFFEGELRRVDDEINRKLDQRRRFAIESGIVDVEDQPREWLGQLGVLKQRRNEANSELAELQTAQRMMEQLQTNPEIDLPTLGAAYTNESALVELKRKIVDQEARIAQLTERFRDEAPEVVNAKETLETLRGLLRREVQARLTMSSSRIEMLKSRLGVLDRDIAALSAQVDAVPSKQTALDLLDNDIKTLRTRYTELIKNADLARMTENTSQGVSVVLLNPAGAPVPQNTRDYVRLALAPAFSLVVGIGLAFFIDGLDLTVRTTHQAEEFLEIPVLATLSERRKRG